MAASHSSTVVGVIQLEDASKRAMDRLSDALDRYSDITEPTGVAAPADDRPTESQIIDWPRRSHPPTLIVRCPMCDESVQTLPLSWEIIIDPTTTQGATSVRGLVQHQHDDQSDVRWPFAAVYTPPPVDDDVVEAYVVDEDAQEDIEEGAERERAASSDREPWGFTPDPDDPDADEGDLDIESAVYQALGGASTCWESISDAGVFQSERAQQIGETLLAFLDVEIRREVARRAASIDIAQRRLGKIIRQAREIIERHEHARKGGGTAPTKRQTIDIVSTTLANVEFKSFGGGQ